MSKKGDKYLLEKTNKAITELVDDTRTDELRKYYNYYSNIRDEKQFEYLKDKFGISTPTAVKFTPLIRSHIDAIIGEFLTKIPKPSISCKDKETISNIFREKQLQIANDQASYIKNLLDNTLYKALNGSGKKEDNGMKDEVINQELEVIKDNVNMSFISSYEKAAQNVITYLTQSNTFDYDEKLRRMYLDLLLAGMCFYRIKESTSGKNVEFEVISPLDYFPEIKPGVEYPKEATRGVYRRYLSKSDIIAEYGKYLSKEDLKSISDDIRQDSFDVRKMNMILGINAPEITIQDTDFLVNKYNLYPVYEVEWIDIDKDNKQQRYRTVRIGSETSILFGKDKNVVRDFDNPNFCNLSINGVRYKNRNEIDYSLMKATMDLQDQYDILQFFKMVLIQNSGSVGDFVDIAFLPKFLGNEPLERVSKYLAYKKQGIGLFDSTEASEMGMSMANTAFNGYDNTVKADAIQAINLAIQDTKQQASDITGVSRERLNGIQQRDAVKNVEVGMQQSYIITKQYQHKMELVVRDILLDSLNLSKRVFKKGLTGEIILGNSREVFTALPEHFTVSNFDIHIIDAVVAEKEKDLIKQMAMELVKGGATDPDILVCISTSDSLTELKTKVNAAIVKKKKENDQLGKMSQQLEEMQKQIKEYEQNIKKQQSEIKKFTNMNLELEKEKVANDKKKIENDYEVKMKELENNKSFNDSKIEQEKTRTNLQLAETMDNNPNNDRVRI